MNREKHINYILCQLSSSTLIYFLLLECTIHTDLYTAFENDVQYMAEQARLVVNSHDRRFNCFVTISQCPT